MAPSDVRTDDKVAIKPGSTGLLDLPVELQLKIFEHHFESFGGSFMAPTTKPSVDKTVPRNKKTTDSSAFIQLSSDSSIVTGKYTGAEAKAQPANTTSLGPTALLLACKEVHEPALEVSLRTRTTTFSIPKEFDDFWRHHKKQGTDKFIRSVAFDLRTARSLRAYALPMMKLSFRQSKVESIELLMTGHGDCQDSDVRHTVDRANIISDVKALLSLLPKDLEHLSATIPGYERVLQSLLNDITCKVCMGPGFYAEQHACNSALTPAAFEQLPDEEQHRLVKYSGAYVPGIVAPGPVGTGYLMLSDLYRSRAEYREWKAQCLFNELIAGLWKQAPVGESSPVASEMVNIPVAVSRDDALVIPMSSRWWNP